MCGIAGILKPGHRDLIRPVTRLMKHRGPDDEGYYSDEHISLGQRRLSIIDLAGGRQPIPNETGRLQLLSNGEIYNSPELRRELQARGHVFHTATDVETALHLYEEEGPNCVKRLRGMFSIAIWDAAERTLFLARDPMGQKPLFYIDEPGGFAFASEVKSLLATGLVKTVADRDALWHYMSLRFVPDRYTFFKGVHKLPAATWMLRRPDGTIRSERYWSLDFRNKLTDSEDEIVDQLDHVLSESVKLHLLSDVPVGSFLSGGIDSSTVTAMMAKATGQPFPTFSIGVKEQSFNELPWARMVSERYGLQGREKVVEADLVHLMPTMIHHMDEPSDPFGVGVYLVSREAAREVKVVLSGDGGDENFAGYDRFAGQRMVDYYAWLPAGLRRQVIGRLIACVPESFAYKSLAGKLKWFHAMSFHDAGGRYAESMSFLRFTDEHKRLLFTPTAQAALTDRDSAAKILAHFNSDRADDLVDRMLHTDLMTRMPDHLLTIADRMSMAHSLEARPPLIDHRVSEFAASIPGAVKLKGRSLKHVLRRVAERYLPRELIYRPKQGFGFPIGIWLRTDLRDFTRNLLLRDSRFVAEGVFDGAYVRRLVDEHQGGKADHNFRLWILLNLEIWHRLYFGGESVDGCRALIDRL
ncbi:MAG: asparagine synthase (glutamine-hydrolyzing), partial [Kiritimatiellae bacterium]|nr:asparagine synthase (glutamine-hydrolyzing) [Kiritimatiellia bacterium]